MSHLLDDITSGDKTRVWSSASAIIRLRDPDELAVLVENLPVIRHSTEKLALGGVVFPNDEHLKFALRKLDYVRDRQGCLCRLYPEYLMFSPEREAEAGNIRIEGVSYLDGGWIDAYRCVCNLCGSSFRVEEREYHYTWWSWQPVSDDAKGNATQA